jgi:hypothetical protein
VYDSPFRPLGWHDVFMLPDCLPAITADPHLVAVDRYVLPAAAVAEALDEGAAVVYAVENRHLRNITRAYTAIVDSRPDPPLASEVNVGEPFFDKQIGDGWYRLEQGYRWSGRHAAVYLPGPSSAAQKLYVSGTVPDVQRKAGPLHLALTIEGRPQPVKTIAAGADDFTLTYDIPADFMGQRMMQVAFTLDRTVHVPSDNRDLGLVFGRFSVK